MFGEFVCLKAIGGFYIGGILTILKLTINNHSMPRPFHPRVRAFTFMQEIVGVSLWQRINVGGFNIGEFSEKSPITNINSSPVNRLVRYINFFQYTLAFTIIACIPLCLTKQ